MELKQTKKDRKISRKDKKQWAVVDDLKHAVWLLKIEIEDKDRKHKSLIKMASKNLAQLAKQAGRITELEAERDELVEALLAFALKISPSTPVFPREWLQAIKLISAIKGKPWEEIEAVVTKG